MRSNPALKPLLTPSNSSTSRSNTWCFHHSYHWPTSSRFTPSLVSHKCSIPSHLEKNSDSRSWPQVDARKYFRQGITIPVNTSNCWSDGSTMNLSRNSNANFGKIYLSSNSSRVPEPNNSRHSSRPFTTPLDTSQVSSTTLNLCWTILTMSSMCAPRCGSQGNIHRWTLSCVRRGFQWSIARWSLGITTCSRIML